MKKNFLFLICFTVYAGFCQIQTITYSFTPHVQVEHADGYGGIIIENCSHIGEEGTPDLPVFGANILLEPGHEISGVNVVHIEYYPVVENIMIRPAAGHFPLSKGIPENYKPQPKAEIYAVNKNYPEKFVSHEYTSFYRGHALGSFLIHPVIYNPVEKRAEFIKKITVEVASQSTERAQTSLRFLRSDKVTASTVERKTGTENQALLSSYKSLCKRGGDTNYDLLVIAPQQFEGDEIDAYIAHKQKWGYKVIFKTLEEITSNYTGTDNAEKIRNCVIDMYENEGISYLMLFGDAHPTSTSSHNKLPYRKMYGEANTSPITIDNLPSDMYFACLDGTWESGDGTWGKPAGSTDLEHEISVGRLCADSKSEIGVFVEKLIKYQDAPVVGDVKKVMIVGEALDQSTMGCSYKEEIVNGGSYNGYTTTGIPLDYGITRLCDVSYYSDSWTASNVYSNFNNNGVHLVNHLGHSNTNYNMKIYTNQVTNSNFTNNGVSKGYGIVYSQGCYNGSFDNTGENGSASNNDCINEAFLKLTGGVVANIGNSRYGLYSGYGTDGPSQRFDRYFFHGIFEENIFNIGDVNSYSKDINKAYIQSSISLRWCAYELNLMGDPSMDIWTDTPTDFDPEYVKMVKNSDTEIIVFTGVPYARVAVFDAGVLLSRGVCDEDGEAILYFDSSFDSSSVLVSISGHNKYRYEQEGMEFITAPPVRELTAEVEGVIVSLEWNTPDLSSKDESPTSYAVYRNGTKIAALSSENLVYEDEDSLNPNTTYEYCVKAVYTGYASAAVCIPVTTGSYCATVEHLGGSATGKRIRLYWDTPDFLPEKYVILRDGEFLKESTQTIIYDDVPAENTEYNYCVIAQYENCDSEQMCKKVKSGIVCGAIDLFDYYVDVLSIELYWNHVSPNQLGEYVITRDGVVIKETTETSFTDIVSNENTDYHYCIKAKFDTCESDEKCATIKSGTTVSMEDLQQESFVLYPNPSSSHITVKGSGIREIVIYDISGKIIRDIAVTNPEQNIISVSELENGFYFMKVYSDEKTFVKRFSVIHSR